MKNPCRDRPRLLRNFYHPLMPVVIAAVIWLSALPAMAQGAVLEVGVWIFPPYAYFDDAGRLQGQAVETVEETLFAMGYTPKLVVMPFKRCLESMRDGLIPMMLPCATSEERRGYMAFSDPVHHITTVLWKRGANMADCWDDYGDLAGLRIGVGQGYSYGPGWDRAVATRNFSLDYARGPSAEQTHFRMAADNRIDMFICDLNVGLFIKDRNAPEFDDIYPCPKVIGENRPFGAPVSLKYFKEHGLSSEEFLTRFNAAMSGVKAGKGQP